MSQEESFDVAIVGGGIIGCAAAYYLSRRGGVRVVLLERGTEIGGEATKAAAGILNPFYTESKPGGFFDTCVQAHALFRPLAQELREISGIDPMYLEWGLVGLLFDADDEKAAAEKLHWHRALGLPIERWSGEETWRVEPGVSREIRGALFFPKDFHIHNGLLVEALAEAARRQGVDVRLGTTVTALVRAGERVSGVETERGSIAAGTVVLAAGAWSPALGRIVGKDIPVEPARGQMGVLRARGPFMRHVIYAKQQYVVPRADGEVIIGSTLEFEGFDKRTTVEGVRWVLQRALEMVPELSELTFEGVRAGLRPYSADSFPILGAFPDVPGLVVATGHSRKGILLGPISGKLVSELILDGKTSLPIEPFSPLRFARAQGRV